MTTAEYINHGHEIFELRDRAARYLARAEKAERELSELKDKVRARGLLDLAIWQAVAEVPQQ